MPEGVDGGIMTLEKNYKAWMNSLLDLGNRNPLLNLKKDGKNVLQITTPNINQLWKEIVINEDKLVYAPDIDKNRYAKTFCSSISQNETLSILGLLRKKAKTISEEQDVNVLYLSFGTLEWEDTVQKKQMSSPLILVPVSIMQDSIKAPISIKINEDEVLVNPTLAYRLKHDFKASLPDLVDENYEKTIEKIKEFAQNNGWNVKEEAYLRIFSFLKINMYKDLEKNKDVLFNHPIIKAFGGESDNANFFAQSISVENLQNFSHDNSGKSCRSGKDDTQSADVPLAIDVPGRRKADTTPDGHESGTQHHVRGKVFLAGVTKHFIEKDRVEDRIGDEAKLKHIAGVRVLHL